MMKEKGKEVKRAAVKSERAGNTKFRDSSGKIIFEDPILCAQFLRNYVDVPMLKDVKPEDIEDVTERYVHLFTEERNSDIVKKVNLKDNSFYLISLIEHKSDVDYNVIMQVFRYIAFIWEDYEKEQEKLHSGISRTKGFLYPPVLPVVFYDGVDRWTAATSLHERVLFSDELSVLMMIDKLRNKADYEELIKGVDETFLREVTGKSPEYLLKLMVQIIGIFLSRLNVPQDEVDTFTEQVKERKMGELFKHFEGWDVQAIRKEDREEARKEAREEAIHKFLNALKNCNISKENARVQLEKEYQLGSGEAEEKMKLYW